MIERCVMKILLILFLFLESHSFAATRGLSDLEPFTGNFVSEENNCEFSFHKSEAHNGAFVLNLLSKDSSKAVVVGRYLFRENLSIHLFKKRYKIYSGSIL